MHTTRQRGFTIIELMISTAVFSTILLVILTAITQIGRMYYKGITTSQTQETARSILDKISQETQFSAKSDTPFLYIGSSTATTENRLLCIGKTRFFYVKNKVSHPGQHALWQDTDKSNTGCSVAQANINMNVAQPTPVINEGTELLPDNGRVVDISATDMGSHLWNIQVKVVFGADDLIEAGDGSALNLANSTTAVCKGSQIGTQFCAISQLSTTVLKRIP